jgi:hypothetical protein
MKILRRAEVLPDDISYPTHLADTGPFLGVHQSSL